MADHGGDGSNGDVVDRPWDEGETMETETEVEQATEVAIGEGAAASSSGGVGKDRAMTVGDDSDRRAPVANLHTPMTGETARAVVQPLDSTTAVEGVVISSGSFGGAGGSVGSGSGVGPSGSPPRDSVKGKGMVVEIEEASEIPTGPVEFRPAAGSSGHRPISRGYFAKFVDEAVLDRLLWDNPTVVATVVAAREERQRAIGLAQEDERLRDEVERARVEEEDVLREMEAAEKARAEAELPRQSVVTVAAATKRAAYSVTVYVPPTPHLFVPSGFATYRPRRTDYKAELVLRDPTAHISMTWAEVYLQNLSFHSFSLKVLE